MKFKKGDIVVAISNHYNITSRTNKWIGIVTLIYGARFEAKTIKCIDSNALQEVYNNLNENSFTLLNQAIKDGFEVEI